MPSVIPAPEPQPEAPDLHAEAQRWVRRKGILYSIIGVYLALSVMWQVEHYVRDRSGPRDAPW